MSDAPLTHPSPQQLADFGQGRLPPEQRSSIQEHLSACPECRRQAKAAARGGTVLAATPLPAGAAGLKDPPPARAPDDLPPELAGSSKYQVLGKLGQGGMAPSGRPATTSSTAWWPSR